MSEDGSKRRTIGPYTLCAEIGAGGTARVHLGRITGLTGDARERAPRAVAIKSLHLHFGRDRNLTAMLMDEARVMRCIRHPNVVSVVDAVTVDGELFLVLDFVLGESLSRLLRTTFDAGGYLSPELVSAIMIGLLLGLHAAHEARDREGRPLGIIHRDVSPQNVLVGVDGVPRLLDFGIAKAVDRIAPTTQHKALKGKIPYMAPEQVGGHSLDRRADIWAASVVLWEMLTRQRPFNATSRSELPERILTYDVPPPSLVAPCTPAFDAIVRRGLAKAREERFATAEEMAAAIAAAVPPAEPHVLGAWVSSTARSALDERADLVAEIEGRPRAGARQAAPPEVRPVAPVETTAIGRGRVGSAAPAPAPAAPKPTEPSRRAYGLLAGIGLGLLLVIVVSARQAPRPTASGASSAPAALDAATPVAVEAASAPPASSPAAASASGHATPSARPRCNPPFRVGPPPDYIRVPKPECFTH